MSVLNEFLFNRRSTIINQILNNNKMPNYIKRVSYIYNTNISEITAPYIDTNYYPNQSTKLEIKIESLNNYSTSTNSYYICPYGVRSNNGYRMICYDNVTNYEFSTNVGKYKYFYPKNGYTSNLGAITIYHSSSEYLVNSKVESCKFDISSNIQWQSDLPLYLFCCNYQDDILKPYYGKFYYLKIFEDNVLVRHYVPIYNDIQNISGVYDLVNNVEYYSPNGNSFSI